MAEPGSCAPRRPWREKAKRGHDSNINININIIKGGWWGGRDGVKAGLQKGPRGLELFSSWPLRRPERAGKRGKGAIEGGPLTQASYRQLIR